MPSDVQLEKLHCVTLLQTIIFLIGVSLLFGFVFILDNHLPTPYKLDDESNYPNAFIAERAQNDLLLLTKNGSRIVGSFENEVGAVTFLYDKLRNITKPAACNKNISVDIQTVTGSYYVGFKPYGAYNVYGNVHNVIAKIHAKEFSNESVLVNAHFDSVPTSPGGSDDGIMCVVMLEVMRKLCKSNEELLHNVVFLFNGAEETPLQASHGFITQHKWAKEIRIVINLESSGSGHKEILFQTGPENSWLLNYYSKVPHPHGQVAGEEIFQSNLIPSDTDFRIFRDYGHVAGFDFAFYKNGYRYHTSYDDVASIPLGSYQHVGDNILSLVTEIANAPEIQKRNVSYGKAVYFDIFGLFMVSYKAYINNIINVLVVACSFLVGYMSYTDFKLDGNKTHKFFIVLTTIAIVAGWIIAGIVVFCIAILVDYFKYSMSWYANPSLMFGLYAVPTLMISCLPLIIWNFQNKQCYLSVRIQSQLQASIVRLIWTCFLMLITCINIRSSYIIMVPILFNTVGCAIIHLRRLHYSPNGWKITYLLCNIFPTMFTFYQVIMIFSIFIPITGRIGSNKHPDLILGLFTMVLTILGSSFFIHFVTLMRKPMWFICICLVAFLISVAITVSPSGFPYSGNPDSPAQQRFMIYHTKRVLRNDEGAVKEDAGYFLLNLDRNSPQSVLPYVKQFEKSVSIEEDCKKFILCGSPLASPRMLRVMKYSSWIPAEEPIIHENASIRVNLKKKLNFSMLHFNLTAVGPDHFNIYLSPKSNVSLVNISLDTEIPDYTPFWNNKPVYFINFASGLSKTSLNFAINLKVPENWNNTVMDIAISAKYVHEKRNKHTVQFRAFLDDFPDWANVIPAIATFESWEI